MLKFKYYIISCVFVGASIYLLTACSPVNLLTRVNSTPKSYVNNYYGENICGHGDIYKRKNRECWVVYSDNESNVTYLNPDGKVEKQKTSFIEPFIVIKNKKNYLKLIEFDPKVYKDNKISDLKSIKYAGWMPKSNLVLCHNTYTDPALELKNKYIVAFKDTIPLYEPEKFLTETDSAVTFYDDNLSIERLKIPLYEIVYRLKSSDDNRKSLITKVPKLQTDAAVDNTLGWINNSMLVNIGQQLHVDLNDSLYGNYINGDSIVCEGKSNNELNNAINNHPALKYYPVYDFSSIDSISIDSITTSFVKPVLNKDYNFVYNIKGKKVFYPKYMSILDNLNKINVVFVIEAGEHSVENIASVANVIQTLEPGIKSNSYFNYKFGIVLPFNKNSQIGLTTNYADIVDFISNYTNNTHPVENATDWRGLNRALTIVDDYKNETNLIVIIGEKLNGKESANAELIRKVADHNCRILGCQIYSDQTNASNNFILQLQSIVEESAEIISQKKRDMIIYTEQDKNRNYFKNVSQNIYRLNFPDSSMVQGTVIFPEKNQLINMNEFKTYVDTILNEIRYDNAILGTSFRQAFYSVGNHYSKFDSVFNKSVEAASAKMPSPFLIQCFKNDIPLWYTPFVCVNYKENHIVPLNLLVNENELKNIQHSLSDISNLQVEYIIKNKNHYYEKVETYNNLTTNVSGDEIIENNGIGLNKNEQTNKNNLGNINKPGKVNKHLNYTNEFNVKTKILPDSVSKYKSTKKIRRYLKKYFIVSLISNRVEHLSTHKIKKYSLKKALFMLTNSPSDYGILSKIQIKDITRKSKFTNYDLDHMLSYFKEKQNIFNNSVHSFKTFTSNGQIYFWIDENSLP